MSESQSTAGDPCPDPRADTPRPALREAFVAVGHREFDAAGIDSLVSLCREAGLERLESLATDRCGGVVQVGVGEPLDEERLASLDGVDEYEYVSTAGSTHLYVVEFTARAFPPSIADRADDVVAYDAEFTEHGITMSLVGPQTAIARLVEEFDAAGLSPDLLKLSSYEGRDRPLDALTERQREVLDVAFEMGYFEVPREVTAEELAAELDLDTSTVVEHLQRAERNLLAEHLPGW